MKTKEITICGKQVTLAYCYATEIAFRNFTGVPIDEFDPKNPEQAIYLLLASIQSYCLANDTKPIIQDTDLMYNAKSAELIEAVKTVFELRKEWYNLPAGEADIDKQEEKEGEEKNA